MALRKHGIKDEAEASQVVNASNMFLKGKNIGEEAMATKFAHNVLFIETSSSTAAQECSVLEEELIKHLMLKIPSSQIKTVKILRAKVDRLK